MNWETLVEKVNPVDLYYYQLLDYLEAEIGSNRMTDTRARQIMQEAQNAVNDIYRRSVEQGIDINAGAGVNSPLHGMMQALPHYNEVSKQVGGNAGVFAEFSTNAVGTEPSIAEKQNLIPSAGTDVGTQASGKASVSASQQSSVPYTVGYSTQTGGRKQMMQGLTNGWLRNPDVHSMLEKAQEFGIDLDKYLSQLQDYNAWNHEASSPRFYRELAEEIHTAQQMQQRQQALWAARILPAEYQSSVEGFEEEWADGFDWDAVMDSGVEPEMPNEYDVFYSSLQNEPDWQQKVKNYEMQMQRDYGDLWGDYRTAMLKPGSGMSTWEEYTRSTPELQIRYEDIEHNRSRTRQQNYNKYAPPARYL